MEENLKKKTSEKCPDPTLATVGLILIGIFIFVVLLIMMFKDVCISKAKKKVSKDDKDLAAMLAIEETEIVNLPKSLDFKITEIKTMIPAAIDQELFDKLFGPGSIKSEEELREKVKQDLTNMFQNDSDRLFSQNVIEKVI